MNDENEWDLVLAEASQVQMPPKMRNTFAIILVFGSVTNPLQHWEKYKVWLFNLYNARQGALSRPRFDERKDEGTSSACTHRIHPPTSYSHLEGRRIAAI